MQFEVFDIRKNKVRDIELDDAVFAAEVKEHLFHDEVRAQLASRRAGTVRTKTRAEVAYSTKKLSPQKKTGNARRGARGSPILRHGGRVFGPKPRDYSYRLPRKMRRAALRSALSRRAAEKRVFVLDRIELAAPKTKSVIGLLASFGVGSALIVDGRNENLSRSARNLRGVKYLPHEGLNVLDILRFDNLFLTEASARTIEGALKP